MAPGPLLAMVLDAAAGPDGTGLAGLSDDQLVGFLSGARRIVLDEPPAESSASGGQDGDGSGPDPDAPGSPGGPSIGAQVTITVPVTVLGGGTGPAGEVDGFGILDHADTHACATGPRPWGPGPGPPGHQPGTTTLPALLELLNITQLTPVIRGPCEHAQAEDRYRPSRRLAHLVKARNTTCTAPGCGRRAAACDLDHTEAYHHGCRTCECNLAPRCKRY
jgi:hypothetical protein